MKQSDVAKTLQGLTDTGDVSGEVRGGALAGELFFRHCCKYRKMYSALNSNHYKTFLLAHSNIEIITSIKKRTKLVQLPFFPKIIQVSENIAIMILYFT